MTVETSAIVLHETDDVATALVPVSAGDVLTIATPAGPLEITAERAVPRCHKIAVRAVEAGAPVRKYGAVIGVATRAIAPGEHVHEHNLVSRRARPGGPNG
ncbi:UxaA family hydrolase [Acuticoccus sp. M5D2P5]|uniref:UxaA family hydrolase n=1 Tax=Acuticoccus kalidii TaxID=2910977 RepID=UPI001F3DE5C4|nr:UxaA family hydrolase [Acuticoccus kalidii]MCF3936682.1 UxaA family hydrolase [Acuticoccus kalidii]